MRVIAESLGAGGPALQESEALIDNQRNEVKGRIAMKRCVLISIVVPMALLLTGSLAEAADVPFSATLTGGQVAVAKDGPYYVFENAGTAIKLGTCSGVFEHRYSKGSTRVDGFATITAAAGNSISIVYWQTWNGTEWVGEYDVVGGTGRFSDATGGGTLVAVFDDDEGMVIATLDGTLAL